MYLSSAYSSAFPSWQVGARAALPDGLLPATSDAGAVTQARTVTVGPYSSTPPVGQSAASARARPEGGQADAVERRRQAQEEQVIQNEIKTLAARDREVRSHEQAHVAAGGQYAGAAIYKFERGPNGVNYAVSGEVQISTSEEATPEATLRKAQVIRRAALAPAEPSPQDRRVAAMATQMEGAARAEMAREARSVEPAEESAAAEPDGTKSITETSPRAESPTAPADPAANRERLERHLSSLFGSSDKSHGSLLSLHV